MRDLADVGRRSPDQPAPVPSLPERLASFVVRYRVPIVAVWVIAAALAMLALPGLGSEANSDPSQFLPSSSPSAQAATLAAPLLGSTRTTKITVVALRSAGPLTKSDLAVLSRERKLAEAIPGVLTVRLGTVSPDDRAAEADVLVNRETKDIAALKPVVNALEKSFTEVGTPPGLQLHLAGPAASDVASNASGNKSAGRIGLFSVFFIIVLLLIVLRSPLAALVTFLPSVLALLVSQRFVAGLGDHGLQISSVTQTLLIVLLLGAGTDYGLFLVYRFREELRTGAEPREAVTRALTRVGMSITASAGTVVLALLTLLLASFGLYRDLAVPLALGVVVTLLAGLTLLPALVALLAGVMFPGLKPAPADRPDGDGWWGKVAARAVRRPGLVLGIGTLVFAALALGTLGYRTAGLNRSTTAPAGSDASVGNAIEAAHFPQVTASPAQLIVRYRTPVWEHPSVLATAQRSLTASGLFSRLASPLDPAGQPLSPAAYVRAHAELGRARGLPLAEPSSVKLPAAVYNAYRATGQYVSPDGTTVRFAGSLRAGDQQSTGAMNATPRVRAALAAAARASGATASGVAGQAASLYDVSQTAGGDLLLIVPVAVVAIAILLGLVLRSLIAPLYLVVSIVLSYFAALGLTALIVIELGGQSGLIFVLPFLMFVFLLALGEDYNILVMTRIREETRNLPTRARPSRPQGAPAEAESQRPEAEREAEGTAAVIRAIGRTGPTITSAGLVLAGTFAVFAVFGGGVMGGQLQFIGLGLTLGILLDTFVVRTLLVPAAAVLLGRWNWWPSRLGRATPAPAGRVPSEPVHDGPA